MEDLIKSLQELMDAQLEHDNAFKAFEGHSWDYFGHNLIQRVQDAQRKFSEELSSLIDSKIRESLSGLNLRESENSNHSDHKDNFGFSCW
jgi:hypothetical protein